MEYEENPGFTPRGTPKLKVPGAKAAANLKRRLSNRLSRTISSERAPGSDASNENVDTPTSKRFSLRHRRSKSRVNKEKEGERTVQPRRSFSVDDMSKLVPDDEEERPKIEPLETEVKVPPIDHAEDVGHEDVPDPEEGLVPPETPVPEQRHVEIRDTRSSSSANYSIEAQEPKELASEERAAEGPEWTERVDPVEEIKPETFDFPPDADATIDAGIEETVLASLATQETTEAETEPKPSSAVHTAVIQADEGEEAGQKPPEKTEQPTEVQTTTRDVGDMIVHETEKTVKDVEKKKKRRKRLAKIIKPASFSLATLAVGLLLIILKKH